MSAAALANTLGVPSAARVLTQGRRRNARAMKRASVQVRARASPDEESPVFRAWDQATNSKKRDDIKKIMILGAGPIVIGQACEFDYSGTQACKSLKYVPNMTIALSPFRTNPQATPPVRKFVFSCFDGCR